MRNRGHRVRVSRPICNCFPKCFDFGGDSHSAIVAKRQVILGLMCPRDIISKFKSARMSFVVSRLGRKV